MSHVSIIKTQFKDLEALKVACTKLGLEFKQNQKNWKWFGRWVNDYHGADAAYKNGIDPKEYGKCDHAIGVKGNKQAYEVGLVKKGNAYVPLFDFWNGGYGLMEAIGKDASKLIETYTQVVAIKEAKKLAAQEGYTVTEAYNDATGEMTITLRKY